VEEWIGGLGAPNEARAKRARAWDDRRIKLSNGASSPKGKEDKERRFNRVEESVLREGEGPGPG